MKSKGSKRKKNETSEKTESNVTNESLSPGKLNLKLNKKYKIQNEKGVVSKFNRMMKNHGRKGTSKAKNILDGCRINGLLKEFAKEEKKKTKILDGCKINGLLREFAKEEKKKNLKIGDNQNLDSLINEYATANSDSEDEMSSLIEEFAAADPDSGDELDSLVEEFAAADSDSGDELDSLVQEFAGADSISQDEQTELTAKVILSSSDDEIDELLDGFEEDFI